MLYTIIYSRDRLKKNIVCTCPSFSESLRLNKYLTKVMIRYALNPEFRSMCLAWLWINTKGKGKGGLLINKHISYLTC